MFEDKQDCRTLKHTLVWLSVCGYLLVSGCASYSSSFKKIEAKLVDKNFVKALEVLEDNKGPKRDAILYWMNRGMILRMNKDFIGSNQAFEQVKPLSEALQAVSVSENTGALSVNDGLRSYAGEDYEIVLVHLYKALNYLELGETDSARVEALQIDVKLQELSDSAFNEDAFARYLMGVIFETLEEWDDALIAYRKAYSAFKSSKNPFSVNVPRFLKQDLLRLSYQQGFTDEFDKYKVTFKSTQWQKPAVLAKQGELIITSHHNLAPFKRERFIQGLAPKGRYLRISTPYYQQRPLKIASMRVRVAGKSVIGVLVEDIDKIATKTLELQMPGITARAIGRAVVKSAVVVQAEKRDSILGLVTQVVNAISERADTRAWLSLPQHIFFARVPLPPGRYDVVVELLDKSSRIIGIEKMPDISITRGHKVYRSLHLVPH